MNTYELVGDLIEGIIKDFNWADGKTPLATHYGLDHAIFVLDSEGIRTMEFYCAGTTIFNMNSRNHRFDLRQPDALDALRDFVISEFKGWKEAQCRT